MKKILLSILCILGIATMASAETYTCVMANAVQADGATTWVCEGITFEAAKNGGTTEPTFNVKNGDMRIYAKGTLTITAPGTKITAMSFDISAQGLKRFTDVTPSTGSFAEQGVNPLVWTGSDASVTLTVGDKAVYGTDGADKAGQFDFTTVTITTESAISGGNTPDTPAEPTDGVYAATTTIVDGNYVLYAADKIATPLEATKNYGYIQTKNAAVVDGTITTAKANQFTITAVDGGYTIQGPDARYYYMTGTYNSFNLSAERTDGDVWSIAANNDGTVMITNVLMGKTMQYDPAYNSYGAYAEEKGVYPTLYAYTKDAEGGSVDPEVPEVPVVDNLVALYDFENNAEFIMDAPLTVVYSSGAYVYVYDSTVYGLIYKYDLGLNPGDVIAKGWKGKVSIYNNLIELIPETELATDGTATLPEPIDIEEIDMASITLMPYNQNQYIMLVGITFEEATPATNATFTGTLTDGTDTYTVTFRNPFKLASVEPGTYDIKAFISLYGTTVQVNPVEFIPVTSGITSVVDENAPVKYYNIQGMPVANPEPGNIYIRVQGNAATKVIR